MTFMIFQNTTRQMMECLFQMDFYPKLYLTLRTKWHILLSLENPSVADESHYLLIVLSFGSEYSKQSLFMIELLQRFAYNFCFPLSNHVSYPSHPS